MQSNMKIKEDHEKYLEFLKSRKSHRNFIFQKIKKEIIQGILDYARWAPSGQNTQPWKVCAVEHPTVKHMLAENSKYGGIIDSAYYNLVIFLDMEKGYDRVKDIQAIGAFIQNILLAIHAYGLGAVWIGEILNKKEEINKIFKLNPEKFELMGLVSIGIPDEPLEKKKERSRYPVDEFTDWF
ncbi:MAG: Nitroreductase [Promethearchaeota archaeon]|nr:MAG: Nitroreductase [Candidatus Lokiarchaeota archaeon]